MKKIRPHALLICSALAIVLLTPFAALAQWAVFDGANYAELGSIWKQDITTYAKIVEEYNQLVKIYSNAVQIYSLEQAMTAMFSRGHRMGWSMIGVQAFHNYTQSKYGETVNWPMMANGSPSLVPTAWAKGTTQLSLTAGPAAIGNLISHLATIEALDGSSQACYQTVADYRSKITANQTAAASLDTDGVDDSPAGNTFMKQLNMLMAATGQTRVQGRSSADLQACLVEQEVLQNKQKRDDLAYQLNSYDHAANFIQTQPTAMDDPTPTVDSWMPR